MTWITIPFGPWLPDQLATGLEGLTLCQNAIPVTRRHYVSARAFSLDGAAALDARVKGGGAFQSKSGVINVFAGTTAKLHRLITAGGDFDDASVAGGYATADGDRWEFVQFGDLVIATNYADPVQSFTMSSSTDFATLAAGAPKAKHIGVINNFLFLGNINDSVDGVVPWRVHWSGFNDATSWPSAGTAAAETAQSSRRDLFGRWGAVQGIVGGLANADGLIIMERGVFRVTYEGPPFYFNFQPITGALGTRAPGSIIQAGNVVYYYSSAGFVACDGAVVTPIGAEQVDNYFAANHPASRFAAEFCAAADHANKLVMFSAPSNTSPATRADRILAYKYDIGRWCEIAGAHEFLFNTMSLGYTADGLDAVSSSIDSIPSSLDSDVWIGGRLQVGLFNTGHQLGYFSGESQLVLIETGEYEDPEGYRVYVNGGRILGEFDSTGQLSMRLGYRNAFSETVQYLQANIRNSDGVYSLRRDTRYARLGVLRFATTPTYFRGVQGRFVRGGRR